MKLSTDTPIDKHFENYIIEVELNIMKRFNGINNNKNHYQQAVHNRLMPNRFTYFGLLFGWDE